MKLCSDHETSMRVAMRFRGLTTEQSRKPGHPHTDESATLQVLGSLAYGRFGVRAMKEDMCPLCELGSDVLVEEWLGSCCEEVSQRVKMLRNRADARRT